MYASQSAHGGTIGGAVLSSAREPGSALQNAMTSNANGLGELGAALEQLEKRLCGVLRPVPPQTAGDGKSLSGVNPAQSPAVDELHAQRGRIESLIFRVNDISSRVD